MKNRLPITIGITGGIGTGKSIVCKVFKTLGIPVYDADSRAKKLMEQDPTLIKDIKDNLGEESYISSEKINKQYLSDLAFTDKAKLELLNKIVHPHVFEDFSRWKERHKYETYLIKEAALLFESGSYQDLDVTVLVYCPLELRIKRILLRDSNRTIESIRRIIDNQMSDSKKKKLADSVIINDDSQMILPQILKIHYDLMGRAQDNL